MQRGGLGSGDTHLGAGGVVEEVAVISMVGHSNTGARKGPNSWLWSSGPTGLFLFRPKTIW